ncbi:MAG: hypothetical protein UU10_C0051G0007 [Parcubacteria group bacterium GW2011_GWF1_40_6]|nr:MAG: hypothetical protein UU10_C0051G0007 [Parcubacteria group bacterium GW2011_GWF1_40_6]
MKNRIEIAKYLAELGFTKGAEIGVDFAYHARVLLDYIPNLSLLCVDLWNRNPRAYSLAEETLARYPGATIIMGDSVEVAKDIPDGSLDFVFIDADHSYQGVKRDIEAWSPKVRLGGVVYGHNYEVSRTGNRGVIEAVDEYVAKHKISLRVIEQDKHNPYPDDRHPCWFFAK